MMTFIQVFVTQILTTVEYELHQFCNTGWNTNTIHCTQMQENFVCGWLSWSTLPDMVAGKQLDSSVE